MPVVSGSSQSVEALSSDYFLAIRHSDRKAMTNLVGGPLGSEPRHPISSTIELCADVLVFSVPQTVTIHVKKYNAALVQTEDAAPYVMEGNEPKVFVGVAVQSCHYGRFISC